MEKMASVHRIHRRLMAQYSTPADCLCSEDHFVYKFSYQTRQLQRVCMLPCVSPNPVAKIKYTLLRHSVARWFRKNIGIANVVELPTGTIIVLYDQVYRYAPATGSGVAEAAVSFEAHRFLPPLKNGVAIHPQSQALYFGEYQNSRPYAAKIMRVWDDGRKGEICYTFPAGHIKHVHSVTWDPFRKRLWIATGDNNSEAGLSYTEDEFQTVQFFQGGSQAWRMVSVLPREDALYWGSDAGKDATAQDVNAIFRWNFAKNCLEKISVIGNPAYYAVLLENGGLVLGTTYEPGMKQPTEPEACLWYSRNGEHWEKLYTLPYANLGKKHRTQYATLNLPHGCVPADMLLFTPLNTAHWDFDLMALQI